MDGVKSLHQAYQCEEDALLAHILDRRFFEVWRNPSDDPKGLWQGTSLELYLTPDCNLACEYCYLHKFGDKLYPRDTNNRQLILANMNVLLSWCIEQGFYFNEIELFSGEIWHMPYGLEVLDSLLGLVDKGLQVKQIMIPTNCSFALDDSTLAKIQERIDAFAAKGIRLCISCSIEGLIIEDTSRPMKSDKPLRDEAFYNRLFAFAKKNMYFFHPMVAASNIYKWPENYDWFKGMCLKHGLPWPRSLMMLEVRNSDWTDESIAGLLRYYRHQIDDFMADCGDDPGKYARDVLGFGDDDNDKGYVNIALTPTKSQPCCTIADCLFVRMGDLTIVPCHRTAYPQFNYGQFVVTDGTITDIKANNPQMAVKTLLSNQFITHHGCDVCAYADFCMRGCFGEQYEATDEVFMPDPVVCKMSKAKIDFLIDTYAELGVLQYLSNIPPTDSYYVMAQEILLAIDKINAARGCCDAG